MISKGVWVALALVACQRHEDPIPTTSAIASTTPSASTTAMETASVTLTPLASVAPTPTTSAAPLAVHPPTTKEAEEMQLKMLQALGSSQGTQNVLKPSNPGVDFSAIVGDAGVGDLRLGGGGPVMPGHRGGLADLGARDH